MPVKRSSSASCRNKRPYVRKEIAEQSSLVFPTSPPQLSEYAFNIHGWALEDGVKGRGLFEVINAYQCTMLKGGFAAKIEELKTGSQTEIYRNDLRFTARELDQTLSERDSAVAQYLVVGYTFQQDDPIFAKNQNFSRYSDNELVGEAHPSEQYFIKWDFCRTPVLVVTPIKENTGTSVRLFGLVKPTSDLCQPVLLTHERIFYRWEFRASAGAKASQRNKNWNQLVVEKAKQLTPPSAIDNAGGGITIVPTTRSRSRKAKALYKKEIDGDYIEEALDPEDIDGSTLSLILDLPTLLKPASRLDHHPVNPLSKNVLTKINLVLDAAARNIIVNIKGGSGDQLLQQLRVTLTKVAAPQRIPEEKAIGLIHHFGRNEGARTVLDEGEAQLVAYEINDLWPKLMALNQTWKLMRLKEVMLINNLAVEVEHMEIFFANALAYLSVINAPTDQTLFHKLLDVLQTATTLTRAHELLSHSRPLPSNETMYLLTLLEEIFKIDTFHAFAVSRQFNESRLPMPKSFNQAFYDYNFEFDLATAQNELPRTVAILHGEARSKNCDIEDLMLWLERIRSYIRQAH